MKKKEKDKISYEYQYLWICAWTYMAVIWGPYVFISNYLFETTPDVGELLIWLFCVAGAVISVVLKKFTIYFDREGAVIRMKHGPELRIPWSEFEFYRITQEGRTAYVIFVRKGRMPDDLVKAACLGKYPDDQVGAKYNLYYQVKEYSKGKMTESELLDMDAFMISHTGAFASDVEKYWKKFLAVTKVDEVVPRIRGIKS